MINKEDFRNLDSLINWGAYAEALEKEVARLEKEVEHHKVALKCYEKLFDKASEEIQELKRRNKNQEKTIAHYQSKTYKLTKALKECCRKSFVCVPDIEEKYCELKKKSCGDCLFNHYMKEVEKDE